MSLILHVPHDSVCIPDRYRDLFVLDEKALEDEIVQMTDMHTAELYKANDHRSVVFPVSRLLVDPERFCDDSHEIMAERGMGVIYKVTSTLAPLKKEVSSNVRDDILDTYYHPHHARLTQMVGVLLQEQGQCLIVDCHSFPSRPLPYERKDNHDLRCEICIGTDPYHTSSKIGDYLEQFFQVKGYSVSVNDPFAGALVPMAYYQKDKNVMSVMYEIRRDLYMDEKTGVKHEGLSKIQADIAESLAGLEKLLQYS